MHKQGALREFGHYAAMNILGMIGISCYILADTYFVAQGLGSLGLAALNIAIPAYNLMNGIGLMLGVGAATQYTIARAQNDRRQADSVFTHTAALGLLLGLLFLLGGLCFAKPLAGLLGADAQTLGMTTTYLRMLWCFGPFFVMNNVLLAFTRNDGAPTVAMCGMIAGSLFNIVFDYIFIFPCGLGMFGAALATGFSPFVSILVLLRHLRRPSRGFHLVYTPLRVSRVPSLCAPGLSSLIGEIASGVVLLLFNLVLLRLSGNTGVAAYGIVANLALVALAIFTGIAQGVQPLVSRLYGRGQFQESHSLLRYSILVSLSLGVLLYLAVFFFTEPLVSIFNSENDPVLADLAFEGLRVYFIGFLFVGVSIVSSAYLAATEHPRPSFAISIVRGAVAILILAVTLSSLWGIHGIWLAFPSAELITVLLSILLIRPAIGKKACE